MANNKFLADAIARLLDRPIDFQREFVDLGAGVAGAVFLSQAVYWSKRAENTGRWFCKTQAELQEETGLTRYEQEVARRKLKALGVLIEEKRGIPCRLWFRIDFNELCNSLAAIKAPRARIEISAGV